jgi:hypothetical protein
MQIKIAPYCEIDGVRNMADSFVMSLWQRLEAEGLPPAFEKSSNYRDAGDWLADMKSKSSLLHVVHVDGELAGCFWLNHFQERFCQFHFFFYRGWKSKTVEIGREVVRQALGWKDKDRGGYVLDMLLGVSRSDNNVVKILTREVGWQVVGEIPYGFHDGEMRGPVPATIYCITRESLKEV